MCVVNLQAHRWVSREGTGQHVGQRLRYCEVCGKTELETAPLPFTPDCAPFSFRSFDAG
jgi:hypothetical protein